MLTKQFPVAVIMAKRPSGINQRWSRSVWQLLGVVVNSRSSTSAVSASKIRSGQDGDEYLWTGLTIRLHQDEAESYYHNLLSDNPKIFVISAIDDQDMPKPFLVSASFDEAHAYMEAEAEVDSTPMPAELYVWIEEFVLTHYVPEPRAKRTRQRWVEDNTIAKR